MRVARAIVGTIIGLAFGVAFGTAIMLMIHHDRERIRAFCQPLGYVGGFSERMVGDGCIAADGSRVYIRDLKEHLNGTAR